MRVGLDVSPLVLTQAGTARWIRGLRGALERREDVEVVPLSWGGPGRVTAVVRDLAWYPWLLTRAARRAGVDVLHCTIFRGPRHSPLPVVLTVHDLAPLRHPEAFPAWTRLYARTRLRGTVRSATRIAAVSEFSRRETAELCGVEPARIDVVPNGVDPVFTSTGAAAEGDYVLAVGTLEPRKNLPRAIEGAA
ncbi:MAG TPA: glycosyltransferase, partial [Gaiellaceae bacterium]|nr:glycosyltransferase [Gaiellaceae bacterium]